MSDRIKVAVRVRRPQGNLPVVCQVRGNTVSLINDDKKTFRLSSPQKNGAKEFKYDYCFDSTDSVARDQSLIYDDLVRGYVLHTLEGYNSCILAYGQTGSGKTFTMMGEKENEGIVPRFCRELFEVFHMCHQEDQESDMTTDFQVKCSFFEIYNEQVIDLLSSASQRRCKIRERHDHSTFVEGLEENSVQDVNEIISCIHRGNENRTVRSTNMNQESSRSHAIFHISVHQKETNKKTGTVVECHSTCKLVDLAGSERLGNSAADGKVRQEGTSINKSLSTLGRVISLLAESDRHRNALVPFRESALTWILKENLGGNSNTCLVACVSPENYYESLSTLRYASLTKRVRTNATINSLSHIEQMEELKAKLRELQKIVNDRKSTSAHQHTLERRVEDIQRANFFLEQRMAKESQLADKLLHTTRYERDSLASMLLQMIESFNWKQTLNDSATKIFERSQQLEDSFKKDRSFVDVTLQKYFT